MAQIRTRGAARGGGLTAAEIKARDAEQQEQSEKPQGAKMLQTLYDDPKLAVVRRLEDRRKATAPEDGDVDPDEWDPDK
jgi:outer membrane translocation and assembly module TamA